MSKSFSSNGLVDDGDVDGVDISCFGRNKKKNVGDDGTEGDAEPAKSKYQVGWPGSLGPGNNKRGKYHCTIDLLFDWFGINCMTTDNFCFYFLKQSNLKQSNSRSMVQ
jgi:hypothetical protein